MQMNIAAGEYDYTTDYASAVKPGGAGGGGPPSMLCEFSAFLSEKQVFADRYGCSTSAPDCGPCAMTLPCRMKYRQPKSATTIIARTQ
jgi:hypothetical protein